MVKKTSEKITIFGSHGEIGSHLVKNFYDLYEIIAISKKVQKYGKIHSIILSNFIENKNWIYPKKALDKKKIFSSKAIILTIGKFKPTENNLDNELHYSNFEINYKFLNYLISNKDKFKTSCRIIVITSMNAEIVNTNSLQYCMSKSQLSTAIDNFKIQLKDSNISIENVMPGPINTKMRKNKINNNLSKDDIFSMCQFLINLDCHVTLDKIKIFNKKNYFNKY